MKKLMFILLVGVVLAGCSSNSDDGGKNQSGNDTTETKAASKDTEDKKENDKKKVYQIGETAVITSDLYDFDYEVTVNDFQLTKEVDGVKIKDFIGGAIDEDRFAVVDVVIKNISDKPYVPNDMFSANFAGAQDRGGETSYDEFFKEGDEELQPGEKMKGHLVYTTRVDYADKFILKYEFGSDEETRFELPNS